MKVAKVKYPYSDEIVEGTILENIDDIKILRKELEKTEMTVMRKFIKSGESKDRFDHIIYGMRPLEAAISRLSLTKSSTKGVNPLFDLPNSSNAFINTAMSMLVKGKTVFLNPAGGMIWVDDYLEIIEESEFKGFNSKPNYYIGNNSKVINLENDYELERVARDYMNKRFNRNYSYIREINLLRDIDYRNIFTKFKEQGGKYVYVYTTGMNVEQMYEYSKWALECDLTHFIFDFNIGTNDDIDKFIKTLKAKANVEVL